MATIRFKFDKGQTFRRTIKGWKRGLEDFRWLWPAAAREVARVHARLFDTEGGSGKYGKWTPLAEATARFRERGVDYYSQPSNGAGSDGPILQWTFRLRDSLDDFHNQGTNYSIRRFQRKKMIYGTAHPLAYLNHYGIDAPQREVLDEEGALEAVVRLCQKTLPNQMRTAQYGRFRRLR